MRHEFKGRSLSVINDLSIAERRYLFAKTRELKEAIAGRDEKKLAEFRIDDPDFGIYEVFLEDSTRTRESFKNAAKFHRVKLSSLSTDSSSFNKGESYADTFNTLAGYDNSIFIIRSKLEGVCRWLEEAAAGYAQRNGLPGRPSFINAGDGKHEHPTQELLDEFTFLEDNDWSSDHLHIALAGDLFHGRTVHSKAHGLTVFDSVKVDLIAPPELAMPTYYTEIMKGHGFEIREFSSIEEYLAQDDIADKWYFTRPQLERMGDRILQRQEELRESITFAQRFLPLIPEHTRFYHRCPDTKGILSFPPSSIRPVSMAGNVSPPTACSFVSCCSDCSAAGSGRTTSYLRYRRNRERKRISSNGYPPQAADRNGTTLKGCIPSVTGSSSTT